MKNAPILALFSIATAAAGCVGQSATFDGNSLPTNLNMSPVTQITMHSTYHSGAPATLNHNVGTSALGSDLSHWQVMNLSYDGSKDLLTVQVVDSAAVSQFTLTLPSYAATATLADGTTKPFAPTLTGIQALDANLQMSPTNVDATESVPGCEIHTIGNAKLHVEVGFADIEVSAEKSWLDVADSSGSATTTTCRAVLTQQEADLRSSASTADHDLLTFNANGAIDIDRVPVLASVGLLIPLTAGVDPTPSASQEAPATVSSVNAAPQVEFQGAGGATMSLNAALVPGVGL